MSTLPEVATPSGRRRVLALGAALAAAPWSTPPAALTVRNGSTVTLTRTTRLRRLLVEPGGTLTAPAGQVLTLTLDGVETGTELTVTGGDRARIAPGEYRGGVVVGVCEQNAVPFQGLEFQLRQALHVTADGPDAARSVPAARLGGRVGGRVGRSGVDGLTVRSTGEVFPATCAPSTCWAGARRPPTSAANSPRRAGACSPATSARTAGWRPSTAG
ncbi:hypothetical protein [Kitasatospora sp. NPDC048407]|uniref:hypothetical protein n=1 Tax=Kitasatospora sp. NPDC048407 TaxID=3364051 RepID=UPI003711084C